MNEFNLIPPFDFRQVVLDPWVSPPSDFRWMMLMAFLVTATCGLIGNYLILRRMALVGDAISHSVLPGLALGFLLFGSLEIVPMMLGAVAAGLVTTVLIELIHTRTRIKADAAIGITFCSLFALGVVMINLFAGKVHLDAECVLYGELSHLPWAPSVLFLGIEWPEPVLIMGGTGTAVAVLIAVFYKELLVSSFDRSLADSLGFRPRWIHYGMMSALSIVVVAAFESVGAILVIAMLILPGATAQLISTKLARCLWLSVAHAAASAVLGVHLGLWLDCSVAGAVVIAGTMLFVIAWLSRLFERWIHRRRSVYAGDEEIESTSMAG